MKYCIGCVHLHFDSGEPVHHSEWTGTWGGEDVRFSCRQGHWRLDIEQQQTTQIDVETAMEKAESCHDFSERSPHPTQPTVTDPTT